MNGVNLSEEILANRAMVIDALRSGKFEQTRYTFGRELADGKRCYCATGVMCVALGIPSIVDRGRLYFEGCFSGLAFPLYTRLGITAYEADTIFKMNDKDKLSFEEIATFLETWWSLNCTIERLHTRLCDSLSTHRRDGFDASKHTLYLSPLVAEVFRAHHGDVWQEMTIASDGALGPDVFSIRENSDVK